MWDREIWRGRFAAYDVEALKRAAEGEDEIADLAREELAKRNLSRNLLKTDKHAS